MRYTGSYFEVGNTELIARRGYSGVGQGGQAIPIGYRNPQIRGELQHYNVPTGDWGKAVIPIGYKNHQIDGQLQHYNMPTGCATGACATGAVDIPDWGYAVLAAVGGYFLLKALKKKR